MTDGRLAVTVDVEDWYHVPAVSGSPFSPYENAPSFLDSWDGRYDYLTEATRRTLDLLDDLDLRATFFVVADVVDNYPGLVGVKIAEQAGVPVPNTWFPEQTGRQEIKDQVEYPVLVRPRRSSGPVVSITPVIVIVSTRLSMWFQKGMECR